MATQHETIILTAEQIQTRVSELGAQISRDYAGREPILVGVLKGAFVLMADLARSLDLTCTVDFMAVSSYGSATKSSGVVRILKDLDHEIAGQDVILVEDIIDSGLTINYLLRYLRARGPRSLDVCALFVKKGCQRVEIPVRYEGFELTPDFVVGYGLDVAEKCRNLPYLAVLSDAAQPRR